MKGSHGEMNFFKCQEVFNFNKGASIAITLQHTDSLTISWYIVHPPSEHNLILFYSNVNIAAFWTSWHIVHPTREKGRR